MEELEEVDSFKLTMKVNMNNLCRPTPCLEVGKVRVCTCACVHACACMCVCVCVCVCGRGGGILCAYRVHLRGRGW